ncbi:LOW QUALITY PROTEIN: hypothetical protein GQ55_3G074500 [Panicum hallii var. hallii]|uniref:Uncharacterized protein n=1 Tax=Panicum hallii var. hallii TaxID=1504633 RepID=A0A2T7E6R9_9POAL|nr:LOW QUALITY PROTEIN: hypothetical protein GQ55_3G074500 [Panicum hallii var. hallii]
MELSVGIRTPPRNRISDIILDHRAPVYARSTQLVSVLDVAGRRRTERTRSTTMAPCWSSVLAVLGVHAHAEDDPAADVEKREESKAAALLRGLLDDWAAAAAEKKEVRNLTAEVRALELALAEASGAREAAEAKRREAEARADAAEDELRAAAERHEAQVEELRRALDALEDRDARIRELEDRIKELNNTHSKWRFF